MPKMELPDIGNGKLERYFMRGYFELNGKNYPQVGIVTFNPLDKTLEGAILKE